MLYSRETKTKGNKMFSVGISSIVQETLSKYVTVITMEIQKKKKNTKNISMWQVVVDTLVCNPLVIFTCVLINKIQNFFTFGAPRECQSLSSFVQSLLLLGGNKFGDTCVWSKPGKWHKKMILWELQTGKK